MSFDVDLAADISQFYADPLGHVLFSYPWSAGQLDGFDGPDDWARGFLTDLGD